jgi:hypothetical protein
MRTAPFNMIVSDMPNDAARVLGESLGRLDDEVPGLIGPMTSSTR